MNYFYKYKTVERFLKIVGEKPVSNVLEVGVNLGAVTEELAECFPNAVITGFEIVDNYVDMARARTAYCHNVNIIKGAITAYHLFEDDLGKKPREKTLQLHIYKATSAKDGKGLSWVGNSYIKEPSAEKKGTYEELQESIDCYTLDEVVEMLGDIDYLKTDCEGSERSFLGCASTETLNRIRFIAGEYHNFKKFLPVMERLRKTHYVAFDGYRGVGWFFAERKSPVFTLLRKEPESGIRYTYEKKGKPAILLYPKEVTWNSFDKLYLLPKEYKVHRVI